MAYIFQCADDAQREITSIFDFVQPTIIALWNLRWQVQGFLSQVPGASAEDLANRFALGSEMRGGELRRACVETSWERQKAEFAEFVLSSVIAAFEDYTGRMARIAGGSPNTRALVAQSLQFPNRTSGRGAKGFSWAISRLNVPSSNLAGVFKHAGEKRRDYSPRTLNELLICYRFFKCLRNMVAHNGGRADLLPLNTPVFG